MSPNPRRNFGEEPNVTLERAAALSVENEEAQGEQDATGEQNFTGELNGEHVPDEDNGSKDGSAPDYTQLNEDPEQLSNERPPFNNRGGYVLTSERCLWHISCGHT